MRRFRLPRVLSSTLFVLCCLLLIINAFFRIGLRFGIETFRYPDPNEPLPFVPLLHPHRPWFFRGGGIRPHVTGSASPQLWPHESGGDRIVNQLMYVPQGYAELRNATKPRLKEILLYFGRRGWSDLPMGRSVFIRDMCPVNTCQITVDRRAKADLILFKDRFTLPKRQTRPPEQIWLLFLLECPLHTQSFTHAAGFFNWTASYRHDSDVVAPYEKWVPYPDAPPRINAPLRNYAYGKTGKVAWFVSNCAARNRRLQYARELSKYIQVDIFGKCGGVRTCPRASASRCFNMLNREYKFYLAFENSNCKDYITEKFFINGLAHDVIPIVMGARPEDYARAAPPHSYIHVEDFSGPADLARYLHMLNTNDTLYNSYFAWKNTGEFIHTRFWCRLCALLHAPRVPKVYTDIETWWAGKGTCTPDHWRKDLDQTTPEPP
ncbi:Glycoprotein 3-alpha-L-fucosyltransferase A like protein [Argiope bruennichi]|uniref:Fucosyltransferase n=1 Tax=Argiope bruennichi TaxID=94029 RepID=A0A8T0ETQ8_ARGBR|nr:Glycoprotein 3-alpha-L-fucosyltransferase A like protein [Argiope bruennichi]